jgi:hypothetical protein
MEVKRMQNISYLKECTIFLLAFLLIAGFGGVAWAANGAMGGGVTVTPLDPTPALNQQYNVDVTLFNTSVSTQGAGFGLGIEVDVSSAILNLSCDDSSCASPQSYVSYVNPGGNGCVASDPCVTSCTPIGSNQVQFNLNNCTIGPLGFLDLATVTVQQDATPLSFFMRGEADYDGTAGTCVGAPTGTCDNAEAGHTCTGTPPEDCDWASLTATAGGSANLVPEQQQQPPAVVPTMTEWGMFIFMVFAGIVSLYYLRKQRNM